MGRTGGSGGVVGVQRIDVGFIPANFPMPYAGLPDPQAGLRRNGSNPFTPGQRAAVIADNIFNNMPGVAVPNQVGPLSDESANQLMEPAEATDMYPEIDHIVPAAEEGANDTRNARVLSKLENYDPATPRPNANQRRLAVYDRIRITQGGYYWNWNDGDVLSFQAVNQLLDYAGVGRIHAFAAATRQTSIDIYNATRNGVGTQNGVTLAYR